MSLLNRIVRIARSQGRAGGRPMGGRRSMGRRPSGPAAGAGGGMGSGGRLLRRFHRRR